MQVVRIFNNSVLLGTDDNLLEYILIGRGIAFQKKPGDTVDEKLIEKKFIYESEHAAKQYVTLVNEIPVNHIDLATKVIRYAESELGIKLDSNIYIAITDHIHYALKRNNENIPLVNAMLWEIQRFYPREYGVSLKIIDMINYQQNTALDDNEAAFIAMHLINGTYGCTGNNTVQATGAIKDILNIVQFHYKMKLDEDSLNYCRFITHLTYFMRRINDAVSLSEDDPFLFSQLTSKYHQAITCVEKIKKYVETKFKRSMTRDEYAYLAIHIYRVTERN